MILQDKDEKEAFDFVCKLADRATDRICNDLNPDDYEKFKHLLVDREEVNGTKIKDNVAFDFDILYWLKNRAVFLGKQVVPHDKCEEQYCGELTHGGDIYKCRKCVKTAK